MKTNKKWEAVFTASHFELKSQVGINKGMICQQIKVIGALKKRITVNAVASSAKKMVKMP